MSPPPPPPPDGSGDRNRTAGPGGWRLLALDTSTERLCLGVCHGSQRTTTEQEGGAQASAALIPAAQALLQRAGLRWSDLDGIAFGRGPGAFTGVRTACAVAQGLALGLNLPVLSLDSLMIVAEDAAGARVSADPDLADTPLNVTVAMDARMDEAYWAVYRGRPGRWTVVEPPQLLGIDALRQRWQDPLPAGAPVASVWAGSALSAFADRLGPPAGSVVAQPHLRDRAAALLRLAEAAAAAGAWVDAAEAQPLYVRDKVALTLRERQQPAPGVSEPAARP